MAGHDRKLHMNGIKGDLPVTSAYKSKRLDTGGKRRDAKRILSVRKAVENVSGCLIQSCVVGNLVALPTRGNERRHKASAERSLRCSTMSSPPAIARHRIRFGICQSPESSHCGLGSWLHVRSLFP